MDLYKKIIMSFLTIIFLQLIIIFFLWLHSPHYAGKVKRIISPEGKLIVMDFCNTDSNRKICKVDVFYNDDDVFLDFDAITDEEDEYFEPNNEKLDLQDIFGENEIVPNDELDSRKITTYA